MPDVSCQDLADGGEVVPLHAARTAFPLHLRGLDDLNDRLAAIANVR